MKKVLITGGTGYIGSHTVVALQQAGYEVVIVDNLANSYRFVVDQIKKITGKAPLFEEFDLTDQARTMEFFGRHADLAGVIHFAAYKSVNESVEKPLLYYRNNLVSLLNVMEGMQAIGLQNLVFSSSCTVYGQPDELPVTEDSPFKQAWCPYGMTKQMSENIIMDTVHSKGALQCISLRYFNPIGAHESALIGELPIGIPNNLLPYITQTAIGKMDVLKVYGDDYDTPDGTAVRDYIHVCDLALAHHLALKRMLERKMGKSFEAFNLGTGRGNTVLEVIHSFENSSGQKLNYKIAGRRPGDVEKIWADTRRANQMLGWKAEKDLDDMTLSAWNWEKRLKTIFK